MVSQFSEPVSHHVYPLTRPIVSFVKFQFHYNFCIEYLPFSLEHRVWIGSVDGQICLFLFIKGNLTLIWILEYYIRSFVDPKLGFNEYVFKFVPFFILFVCFFLLSWEFLFYYCLRLRFYCFYNLNRHFISHLQEVCLPFHFIESFFLSSIFPFGLSLNFWLFIWQVWFFKWPI